MAKTNIKKNAAGYGYKYTDLAEIHNYLESNGIAYRQYIEPIEGTDYIVTVPIINGEEKDPIRGCRVVEAKLSGKSNPVQEYGASLTYCRRYSLLMAFGLATTDDDAESLTVSAKPAKSRGASNSSKGASDKIKELAEKAGVPEAEICAQAAVRSIEDMHPTQAQACITWLEGML